MTLNNVLVAYQKANISTSNPIQLIVLCYDKAIADLESARQHHEHGNFQRAYEKLWHANKIVSELLFSIDYEAGGEIAVNLSRIYTFILREFAGINSRKDATIYNDIIKILVELRSGWEEISGKGKQDFESMAGLSQSMEILA